MHDESPSQGAGRVLHVCYCCANPDAVLPGFLDVFELRVAMRTSPEPASGSILGMEHEIIAPTSFLYDQRGPRVGTALELQEWISPSVVGRPFDDPTHVGMQSLGMGVADVVETARRLVELGWSVVGSDDGALFGAPSAVVRDPVGGTVDVVEAINRKGRSRFQHVRVTCSDIDVALSWYQRLGFALVAPPTVVTARDVFGAALLANCVVARLRLPEASFELVLVEWTSPRGHGSPYAEANHAGLYRVALRVTDIRECLAELAAAGVVAERGPTLVALPGTPVPDLWVAFVHDPDGVPFELVQRPREAFETDIFSG